jgi:hypothetical protein
MARAHSPEQIPEPHRENEIRSKGSLLLRLAVRQNKRDCVIQCSLIPEVGIAQDFFTQRQNIQFQLPMEPATGQWLLAGCAMGVRLVRPERFELPT